MARDCKYFQGDRPCVWHKREGVVCECDHYVPLNGSLVVIKLDAMGDVLRTTCLLPQIQKKWPAMRVTWITREESLPLLENNPHVDEIVPYGPEALLFLSAVTADCVINLDAGAVSARLATLARSEQKIGYVLNQQGQVVGTNPAAEEWLRMGVFDDLKKANERTYQEIMCSILGVPAANLEYVLEMTGPEIDAAAARLQALGVNLDRPILGIHTGGGGRWKLKQWNESSFADLIPGISRERDEVQILLFGGPLERDLNRRLAGALNRAVFDTGCDNSVREFAALVNYCSVVLSGDSLAMHVALALKKRVVVLFGPTSHAEIEIFGQGEKIVPELDCLVCYKRTCDFVPNCMDSISVGQVKEAVLRQLDVGGAGSWELGTGSQELGARS